MQQYLGVKLISAEPEERKVNDVTEQGYRIVYEDGYRSWSPKDVFEKAYRPITGLTFGLAVEAAKQGSKIARAGWNGKNMFVFLVPGSVFKVSRPPLLNIYALGTEIKYSAHLDMKTADGSIVPWLASQADVLAEDWMLI